MMTQTGTMQQPEPLSLIRWYQGMAWARRRARHHADMRRVPILLIAHPEHGYAAVSERSYPRYESGCEVVERIEGR
jgi:hypothetical protein